MRAAQKKKLQAQLLDRRRELVKALKQDQAEVRRGDDDGPLDLADTATELWNQEFNYSLSEKDRTELSGIDEALGRKRGTMAKVWTLQQYRTAQPLQGGAYRSSKTQIEVRCHSRQWRVFYFSAYSGEMGTGEQSYAQATAGAWRDVQPGTVSEAVYRVGCHPGENQ